jgi:hypothetical protein
MSQWLSTLFIGGVVKTIRISKEVWEKIKESGEFGETPDAVLRRLLEIKEKESERSQVEPLELPDHFLRQLNKGIENGELVIRFDGDKEQRWKLPERDNHDEIRRVRDKAVEVAIKGGASHGQIAAVKKVLTATGYFVRPLNPKGGSEDYIKRLIE